MKEKFKEALESSPSIVSTVEMQLFALQRYMSLLGFNPHPVDHGFNEGQYGFERKVYPPDSSKSKYKMVGEFISFQDAVTMYNGGMYFCGKNGMFWMKSNRKDDGVVFEPAVLQKAEKEQIFEAIGLQWNKKHKTIISTKKLLKFN